MFLTGCSQLMCCTQPDCELLSAVWFRGRLLFALKGCYHPLAALLQREFAWPKLGDLPTAQTLVPFVEHGKLWKENKNTLITQRSHTCSVMLKNSPEHVSRYLSRCQSSDWLGEQNPHRAVHVQSYCAGNWNAQLKPCLMFQLIFSRH